MRKPTILLSLMVLTSGMVAAVASHNPGLGKAGSGHLFTLADKTIEITPVTGEIFRVTTYPGVGKPMPKFVPSQSAVLAPDDTTRIIITSTPDKYFMQSPSTRIEIDRATGLVSFFDASGNFLIEEAGGVDNSGDVKTVKFFGNDEEAYYGAGERGHSLNLNGDTLRMYNRQNYGYTEGDSRISQMNITVPYFVSDAGYGILFDDYNDATLILGDTITYTSETPKGLSYYFINGEGDMSGATSRYSKLTGLQGLPPFWALGYITSKYGYRTQDEALGVIDTLKRHGYPVDGMVLDLYWYGQETDMGRLEWNKEQWPDHKSMLAELKNKGVNMVAISQPYINKIGAIDNYNELVAKGMTVRDAEGENHDVTIWVGESGMFDVSNPDTREWLWNRYRNLTLDGIEGWWGDLGEPEVHPETIYHHNGETASQYHNVYGNEWSRIIYDGFAKEFPEKRLMLLMRGGTAGLQRYNVFPWSTDVSRSWGGMQPQVKIMLNSGLSGLGYMSSDLGGFAVDPANPLDPELYVRWVQMGAFTPTFRTHAQLKPEPYHYPEYEKTLLDFVKQRYQWLPYNYTLAYENAAKGLPLARPLNFYGDNPEKKYSEIHDEYLWGENVLIAPVMQPGARKREVTFPSGTWVNWNNPRQRFAGSTTASVAAPMDELPMFIRLGAFIPQYMEPVENTGDYNPAILDVLYFPAPEASSYEMFEDNRVSPASLKDGAYKLFHFDGHQLSDGTINIELSSSGAGYEGMPSAKDITLIVMCQAKAPSSVKIGEETLTLAASATDMHDSEWAYDSSRQRIIIKLEWNYSPIEIEIQ